MTEVRTRDHVGSFDDIAEAAIRTVGMDDFGGTEHEEGLRILVDDLASDAAGLTPVGNYLQRQQVKSALIGRLLSQFGMTSNPAYADVAIKRPLFVLGLPRTGTTALHRLLHADPAHQGLELWLTEFPQPRPEPETWEDNPVYQGLNEAYSQHQVHNPEFMGIHYMDAASVEECWRILRQSGKSMAFESLACLPRYSEWLAAQDWADAYARFKANLQLIGMHDADQRWVLKNPSHLIALPDLMATFPDALIVRTHRDPVTSFASACSLSAEATDGWSTTFVGTEIGRTQLDMLARQHHAFERARGDYPKEQFIDIDYDDFVADPGGTVKAIYAAFGIAMSAEAETRVDAAHAESRKGGKRPAHSYDLSDYGVTESQVRDAFG